MRFALDYRFRVRFASIAALSGTLAGILQIGSCAAIGQGESGMGRRIVDAPNETRIQLSNELPSVRCWVSLRVDRPFDARRVWKARLNAVNSLTVRSCAFAADETELKVRTRTSDGLSDSVFWWGVGDNLDLSSSPALPNPRLHVTSWKLFRADGTDRLNDSSGRATLRFWVNVFKWVMLGVALLAVGCGIGVDPPREESFRDVVIREQIELIEWGDKQRTRWMQQLVARAINPQGKESLDEVIGELSVRDPETIKSLKREYRKQVREVIDRYEKYVLSVIEPPVPLPQLGPGAPV